MQVKIKNSINNSDMYAARLFMVKGGLKYHFHYFDLAGHKPECRARAQVLKGFIYEKFLFSLLLFGRAVFIF